MNFILRVILIFATALVFAAFGQDDRRKPAVDVSTPNRVLGKKAADVCDVDFRNSRMIGENSGWNALLRNGRYQHEEHSLYESTTLDHVSCFEQQDSGHHAVVVTDWTSCGGSCNSAGVVQIFALRASRPVIVQQFVFDSHAAGTGATFDKDSLTLTITGRSDDGSANCCPANFDVVTYQWRVDKFVEVSYRRVPAPPASRIGEQQKSVQ